VLVVAAVAGRPTAAESETLPAWPEELGRISRSDADRAAAQLSEILARQPSGPGAAEARVRLSLLRLEPLRGRDAAAARRDLAALERSPGTDPWVDRAGLVRAWVDEHGRDPQAALGTYRRLTLESLDPAVEARAFTGLGRIMLRQGKPGSAAALFQAAIEHDPDARAGAPALRELAVRTAIREVSPRHRWGSIPPAPLVPAAGEVTAITAQAGGGLLVADRKERAVVEYDREGRKVGRCPLDRVHALATDPMGRVFASAGDSLYRIDAETATVEADLTGFAPVRALAADFAGRVWLVDRKGERIAKLDAGETAPVVFLQAPKGVKFSSIVWDGLRLLVADARAGRILEARDDGTLLDVASIPGSSIVALAADPAGQIAVLDARQRTVLLLAGAGTERDRAAASAWGLDSPTALALDESGGLLLYDASRRAVVRIP
jgi:hypothetical protein